ncbi:hypothetical protein F4782DRAFT_532188 [Xylaria castorea]|nr:hypothetical protein F4782DRAFT_532188 [Xylaria castorea]
MPLSENLARGRRPGILTVKSNLGGPLLEKQAKGISHAKNEIQTSRASMNLYINNAGSPFKAKQLRLAAYRLKLARSLYMVGDRLDDWILHERAWTAGDQHLLDRAGLKKETFEVLQPDIKKRDANIKEWRGMQKELDRNVDAGEKENEGNDGADQQQQQQHEAGSTRPEPQIAQRRRWYDKMAAAKLRGQRIPKWEHKKVVDPFKAGGPPGWEDLPTETYWERLKYMWIISFWRLYQLKELEP